MTDIVATQTEILWQPNRAVCAVVGLLATAMVLAFLIFMFDRPPETSLRAMPMELHLISSTGSKPAQLQQKHIRFAQQRTAEAVIKPLRLVKPEVIPLQTIELLPTPIDWQQQMKIAVESQPQSNENPNSILSNKMQVYTPLQQALNAPRKPATMKNGESYRDVNGSLMFKYNGLCTELQTVQVGPSPSNHATVAFLPKECPGEHKPTMGEELSKWVDQEVQKHPPPR